MTYPSHTAEMLTPTAGLRQETAPVRALLVDLDGTLYSATPVRLAMAAELGLGHWRALSILRVFRQEQERLRDAPPDSDDPYRSQMKRTAARTGLSLDIVEALVQKWMQARPGKWLYAFRRQWLLALIHQFRAQGGRTALVSDYPARVKLHALRASEQFDVVVASGETPGLSELKPSPQSYLRAASELAVPPSECVVLGDRLDTDGEAARRAGIRFCQVGGKRSLQPAVLAAYLSRRHHEVS